MFMEFRFSPVIFAAAAAAVLFAVRYYYRNEDLDGKSRSVLYTLKTALLLMLIFAAFKPVVVFKKNKKELKHHAVLIDNSASIPLGSPSDSALFSSIYRKFSSDPSFIFYRFGYKTEIIKDSADLDFKDRFTNISGADTEAAAEKAGSGTVILFTDGNFTDADNYTLSTVSRLDIVRGSVRTGDPDIFIKAVDYEDNPAPGSEKEFSVTIGYTGPEKKGEFTLEADDGKGKKIRKKGHIPSPGAFTTVKFETAAMTEDLRETLIFLSPLENEKNTHNNKKSAVQRLLRSSYKFLITADTPSLDLSFFLKLLSSSGYSFDVYYGNSLPQPKDTGKYKALISFSLPVKGTGKEFSKLTDSFSSMLFFTGARTDLAALERLSGTGLKNFSYSEAKASISAQVPDAGKFLLARGDETADAGGLPEVTYNPFFIPDQKNYETLLCAGGTPAMPVLFKSINKKPEIFIASFRSFWMPLFNDPESDFSTIMLNLTDRTAVKESSDRIRIRPSKPEYYSGEMTNISGTVLDENLRPVKEGHVRLTIAENGLMSDLIFDGREWTAGVYIAEPGVYTAVIETGEGERKISGETKFTIRPNDLETARTGADTLFLSSFASSRKGRLFPPDSAFALMSERSGIYDTVTTEKRIKITENFWYFLSAALFFLSELALRKYKDLS